MYVVDWGNSIRLENLDISDLIGEFHIRRENFIFFPTDVPRARKSAQRISSGEFEYLSFKRRILHLIGEFRNITKNIWGDSREYTADLYGKD